jgi:2-aminoethylphosphonate-pyruvate transaminase
MGGSGTAAMEAMAIALVRPGRRLLVCRNGHYGERLERIAAGHRVAVSLVDAAHTEPIDPGSVAAALDAHDDIDAVAVVVHETTTGLLNPVGEIAQIARARGVPVVADAISAFGSEPLDLAAGGIDLVAATSNKNLHGLPGVAIILASPVAQARIAEVPPRSLYFDLGLYLDAQRRGTVPFTPPIPATYALEAALDELLDEGVRERERAYRARMAYLDGELDRLGLVPVVAPDSRSGSVRSVPLPEGLSYPDLHDALKAEGYVIYAGLGSAAASSFRICALGTIRIPALQGFVAALERALATLPRTQVPTTGVAPR